MRDGHATTFTSPRHPSSAERSLDGEREIIEREAFRFCISSGKKAYSTIWYAEETAEGFQIATRTPCGDCKIILSPAQGTLIKFSLKPFGHRKVVQEFTHVVKGRIPHQNPEMTKVLSIIFPTELLSPINTARKGTTRRPTLNIDLAPAGHAVDICVYFTRNLMAARGNCADVLYTRQLRGGHFVYICQFLRHDYLKALHLGGIAEGQRNSLPGIRLMESDTAGAATLVQTSPGRMKSD